MSFTFTAYNVHRKLYMRVTIASILELGREEIEIGLNYLNEFVGGKNWISTENDG